MPSTPGSPAAWPPEALDARLRALHGQAGAEGELSKLHEAALCLQVSKAARRFHLTQAWVFALAAGDEGRAAALAQDLRRMGGL